MSLPDWAVARLATFDYDDDLRAKVTHELGRFWRILAKDVFDRLPVPFHAPLLDALAFSVRTRLTLRVETLRDAKRESDILSAKIRDHLRELVALLNREQQLEAEYDIAPWTLRLYEALDGVSQESEFRAHRSVTGLDKTLGVWQNTSQPGPTLVDLIEYISSDRDHAAGQFLAPFDFPPNLAPRAIPLLDLFDEQFARFLSPAMLACPRLTNAQLATIYSVVTGGDYSEDAAKKRTKRSRDRARDDATAEGDV